MKRRCHELIKLRQLLLFALDRQLVVKLYFLSSVFVYGLKGAMEALAVPISSWLFFAFRESANVTDAYIFRLVLLKELVY